MNPRFMGTVLITILVIVLAGSALTAYATLYKVEVGEVAILSDPIYCKCIDPIARVGPAWYTKAPWVEVTTIYIATQIVEMWTDFDNNGTAVKSGDWPSLETPTTEGLTLHMDVAVRWHISGDKVFTVYQNFRAVDYKQTVIFNAVRNIAREVTGKFSALDLYGPKRDVITQAIQSKLSETLSNDPVIPNTIVLESFYMRNVWLPIKFKQSVEAKQVAEQNVEKAQYERLQALIQANATAQVQIIQASGIAEAVRVVAERFKGLTTQELNAYLTLKYIEALQAGFIAGNKVIILLPSTAGQFILQLPTPQS